MQPARSRVNINGSSSFPSREPHNYRLSSPGGQNDEKKCGDFRVYQALLRPTSDPIMIVRAYAATGACVHQVIIVTYVDSVRIKTEGSPPKELAVICAVDVVGVSLL
ncbi:hypothetical protein D9758_008356 [Tetrapyrgos nigripes]|uniref:Uncharacterized protein n=1 Tax=Tetrapyrgos nigripes TaxID=182062 RepID=A0A8H5LN24_9AGAR|nr:hypothetical protein D9758_008356 [Tetrapyrgos nigripes]